MANHPSLSLINDAYKIPNGLYDLLLSKTGIPIAELADWRRQRERELSRICGVQYGGIPPIPRSIRFDLLHSYELSTRDLHDVTYQTYKITSGIDCSWSLGLALTIPSGDGPFPVVLCGDACWRNADEQVVEECIRRGYIVALFNRTELAPDNSRIGRGFGLYQTFPELPFGAISAWAWGYHRCVDFLVTKSDVRSDQIAIVGHSRGGKAVLLAGATDERIALTSPNNSGLGGAGSYHIKGPNAESLDHILSEFPHWFGPQMSAYISREHDIPFDQHMLKAAIAPRGYLSTEALGDQWANPFGTLQTHEAALAVWRFLGAEDRIGIEFREGRHEHGLRDWQVFLDFADRQFGKSSKQAST